jgi:hypothetical protein
MRLAFALLLVAASARAGSIKGTVVFEGEPPEQRKQERNVDAKCSPQDKADEAIVVAKGKLRDVLVRIKNGEAGKHDAPAEPVVVDQRGCMYAPRVVGIVVGQKLVVRNGDATNHNVWGVLHGKDLVNKMQMAGSADLAIDPSAAKPDDVIELKCGVHAWMKAYVPVQDHSFFAVTGADGKFEIKDLPVGTYTLEAWHPVLGTKSVRVKIGKGKLADVTARFSYKQGE